MNRKSFMAELRSLLAFLDAAERERVLNRYERMFDEAGAEGEATVIRCFGSPVRQVLQIEREYREAVASGETPFADGGAAAAPAETEAPEEPEIVEEEYAETEIAFDEAEPETEEPLPEETGEEPELLPEEPAAIAPEVPAAAAPESPAYDVLPEIDLDDLDFSDLGLTFPKKTETPEEPIEEEAPEETAESDEAAPAEPENTPETESAEDALLAALLAEAAAETLPEPDEPSASEEEEESPTESEETVTAENAPEVEPETEETAEPLQPETEKGAEPEDSESPETLEEPETPDEAALTYDPPAEEPPVEEAEHTPEETPADEPAEEAEIEEEDYEEVEERRPVSGGRAFAAVVVTIPMLAVWALLFGLSLGLGVAVLGIGAALVAVGVYLTGYVFNGAIVRMPDLLLTAGAALGVFALALLLLWSGVSIAVAGCTLTVRLTRSIYRSILYPKKEENGVE